MLFKQRKIKNLNVSKSRNGINSDNRENALMKASNCGSIKKSKTTKIILKSKINLLKYRKPTYSVSSLKANNATKFDIEMQQQGFKDRIHYIELLNTYLASEVGSSRHYRRNSTLSKETSTRSTIGIEVFGHTRSISNVNGIKIEKSNDAKGEKLFFPFQRRVKKSLDEYMITKESAEWK